MLKKEEMITLLKNDVVPALGCTEPVCVALCAANAGKMTENKIRSIEVEVNAGIYKNGMSAGIPGCDYVGLPYAAALGAYLKNPEKGLELLEDITPEILEQMKELCGMAAVSVKIKEQEQGLYVKCKIKTEADMITSVIRGTHTNLVYLEKNGKIIYEKNQENGQASDNALIEALKQMTIAQIRQVADTASEEELHFLMDGVEMNERLAAYSEDFVGYELEYTADYFRIGENIYTDPEYGLFFEDIFTVNDGGRFLPHVCDFMEEEGIDWHDDKYYGQRDGMELHLLVYIDFEETVFYETYDFIPVGTRFTLLNEDTMLVEFWGKTLLARRVA